MSLKEDHDLLARLWDKAEIDQEVCNVLNAVSGDVLAALLEDDLLEAGRIIRDELQEIFEDSANAERDLTVPTRGEIEQELTDELMRDR